MAASRARRWVLITLAVTAVVVYGASAALGDNVAEASISFAVFGLLFGGTAGVVGAEVTRFRRCPRCGCQQEGRAGRCPECDYDVKARPRFRCSEGHAAAYDEGLCHCGRRLQPWTPPDMAGHVRRSLFLGGAIFLALVITGLLLGR